MSRLTILRPITVHRPNRPCDYFTRIFGRSSWFVFAPDFCRRSANARARAIQFGPRYMRVYRVYFDSVFRPRYSPTKGAAAAANVYCARKATAGRPPRSGQVFGAHPADRASLLPHDYCVSDFFSRSLSSPFSPYGFWIFHPDHARTLALSLTLSPSPTRSGSQPAGPHLSRSRRHAAARPSEQTRADADADDDEE